MLVALLSAGIARRMGSKKPLQATTAAP
jgi:molybdopterin-guanine dinucleotide biosynthesis protein A